MRDESEVRDAEMILAAAWGTPEYAEARARVEGRYGTAVLRVAQARAWALVDQAGMPDTYGRE